jgi:hypothetical protein
LSSRHICETKNEFKRLHVSLTIWHIGNFNFEKIPYMASVKNLVPYMTLIFFPTLFDTEIYFSFLSWHLCSLFDIRIYFLFLSWHVSLVGISHRKDIFTPHHI